MIRYPRRLFPLILIAAVAAACGEPRRLSEPGFTAHDSSGVRLAVNRGAPPASSWTLSGEPLLVIGGANDPDAALHNAGSAARRENGEIVVANSGASEVLIFDATGRRAGRRGRQGQGPGEFPGFGTLSLVSAEGESIVVRHSAFQDKLVRFDSLGLATEVTASLVKRGAVGSVSVSPGNVGFYVNIPGSGPDMEGSAGDVVRTPSRLVRFSYAGEGPDTIARYRGSTVFFADVGPRMAFGGGSVAGPSVLAPLVSPTTESAGGGDPWRVIAGDEENAEFDVYAEDGAHLMRVRWEAEERVFSAADREAIRADFLAGPFGRREPGAARRALDVMPPLEQAPVYDELHVDRLGFFWVKRYPLPTDAEHLWWIFRPDGQFAASLSVPLGLRILEIGEDYLLGMARDDLDVQRIELWALQR